MLIDDYELTRQIEQMKDVNRDDVIALIARQKPGVTYCEVCRYCFLSRCIIRDNVPVNWFEFCSWGKEKP